MMYRAKCRYCEQTFPITKSNVHSRQTELREDGRYLEMMNVDCPKCGSHLMVTARFGLELVESVGVDASGTKGYYVYPDLDGTIDDALWQELPEA